MSSPIPSLEGLSTGWPLLSAVFVTSLVGSVHCAGMCGPLTSLYSAARREGTGDLPHVIYHLTRGVMYMSLGAAAGIVGETIDWAGEFAGVSYAAALLCGVLVVVSGLSVVFPTLRLRTPVARYFGPRLVQLRTKPRELRAAALGALTPLLPCGWLYIFAVAAAGTGSAWSGAFLMGSFWLGTIPALLGFSMLLSRLGDRLRARMPVVAGIALVLLGVLGVAHRVSYLGDSGESTHGVERESCH